MVDHFAPIIRRWPKVVDFAAEVGAPERSVREWLRNDSIPATWFAAVVRASIARGYCDVTADRLSDLAERKRLAKMAPRGHQEATA
jgi:hypothetical protein